MSATLPLEEISASEKHKEDIAKAIVEGGWTRQQNGKKGSKRVFDGLFDGELGMDATVPCRVCGMRVDVDLATSYENGYLCFACSDEMGIVPEDLDYQVD